MIIQEISYSVSELYYLTLEESYHDWNSKQHTTWLLSLKHNSPCQRSYQIQKLKRSYIFKLFIFVLQAADSKEFEAETATKVENFRKNPFAGM